MGIELYDTQQQLAKAHIATDDLQQEWRTIDEDVNQCDAKILQMKALVMQAQGACQEEEKRVRLSAMMCNGT